MSLFNSTLARAKRAFLARSYNIHHNWQLNVIILKTQKHKNSPQK